MHAPGQDVRELATRALASFDAGRLDEARRLYQQLLTQRPESVGSRLQLALVEKYQRNWPACLASAHEALRLGGGLNEAAHWTAGIAATALREWKQARQHWKACGITFAPGTGPIDEHFGPVALRLNPWGVVETVFAMRIDPARARISNVPLPGSGHRFQDLVLHDGVQVGKRQWFRQVVPVFNELQRLEASDYTTFTAFVVVDADEDIEALQRTRADGIGLVEDWTASLGRRCLRCDYGVVHRHRWHEVSSGEWNPDRTLGVAALSDQSARALLDSWQAVAPARRQVEAIATRETPAQERRIPLPWWQAPPSAGPPRA